MRLLVRGHPDALRSSLSFSASGMLHGALLACVVFGKTAAPPERGRSLYDEAIRPYEKQIVWYHAPDRLPDVRPAETARADRRPLRAIRKAEQRMVVGERDDSRPPQLVWAPPSIELPPPAPLPNVLAVETRAPARRFTPPAARVAAVTTPALPEADAVGLRGAAPAGPGLSPLKKSFTPPAARVAAVTTPALPEAEAVGLRGAAPAGPGLSPLKKSFTPPTARVAAVTTPALPEAEAVGLSGAAPAGPGLSPLKKSFTPPAARVAAVTTPALPEADAVGLRGAAPAGPELSPLKKSFTPPAARVAAVTAPALPEADAVGLSGAAPAGPGLSPLKRSFTPPPAPSAPTAPIPLPDLPAVSAAHLAIVGLDPAKSPILATTPAPRAAGFSAGPKPEPNGAATDGGTAGIVVPGVTVRDGPTRQTLLAAIRPMAPPMPSGPPPDHVLPATRIGSAPDPSLEGRAVYTVAIQMPNVTSYSGSWLVWYAEREEPAGGAMRAPSPVRKVDPKYIAAAAAEGVQGVVRLGAVIRKDGRVDEVKLLRHLDDRLDRSAMESLAKWQFEPARRGGVPVDVDAVFEIPFRLAPKPSK